MEEKKDDRKRKGTGERGVYEGESDIGREGIENRRNYEEIDERDREEQEEREGTKVEKKKTIKIQQVV